jgi:hypothetical protein
MTFGDESDKRGLFELYSDAEDWILDHTLRPFLTGLGYLAIFFYKALGEDVSFPKEQCTPEIHMGSDLSLYLNQIEYIPEHAAMSPEDGLDRIVDKYVAQGVDRETVVRAAMEEARPLHRMCMVFDHPNLRDLKESEPGYGDRVWERVKYVRKEFQALKS